MTACLSLAFSPVHLNASVNTPVTGNEAPLDSVRTKTLLNKINEIAGPEQRHSIKNKLSAHHSKSTNNDGSRDIGGGVYISAGALIIIILLIILF